MSETNVNSVLSRVMTVFAVLAFVGLGIYFFVIVPNMQEMRSKVKRSELSINLRMLQTMQNAYFAEKKSYVAAKAYPPQTSTEPQTWVSAESGGFQELGFEPMEPVRGSYWVEVTKEGFTAYGISDVDGDGTHATYTATTSQEPTAMTAENVS